MCFLLMLVVIVDITLTVMFTVLVKIPSVFVYYKCKNYMEMRKLTRICRAYGVQV